MTTIDISVAGPVPVKITVTVPDGLEVPAVTVGTPEIVPPHHVPEPTEPATTAVATPSDRPIWIKRPEPKPSTAEAMHPARSGELLADLNESVEAIREYRHVCPSCDRKFASAAGLDSHRRWSHQSPPGPAPKPAPAERFAKPAPAQKAQDDGIDWPWKCACGHGTGQRVEMIRHINLKGGTKGGHRIVDQPPPRLVPSGVNARPDTDRARVAAFAEPGGELAD